jgi:prepilin-type N-terminal cleavage/methylation domain-containing protein
VAIRPPKSTSQGFTLVEMLVTLLVAGIIMGFAVPSLLSLNKPLRDGTLQFKSQLSLIRSKAISSSRAYRIKPKFATAAETIAAHSDNRSYPQAPNNFIVEYAANCQVTAIGGTSGWQAASQLDLDLPVDVGITDIPSTTISNPSSVGNVTNSLTWNICFDSRGIAQNSTNLIIKDFRGDNSAKIALINISKVGSADIYTYSSNTSSNPSYIPLDSQGNPVF